MNTNSQVSTAETPSAPATEQAAQTDVPLLAGDTPTAATDTLLGSSAIPASAGGTTPPVEDTTKADDTPALPVPGLAPLPDDATDDQKRDFQNKLRAFNKVPDSPEGYGNFGFPEEVKIDTESAEYKRFTSAFHKAGLNSEQARMLLEEHSAFTQEAAERYKAENDRAISDYRSKVKTEFVKELGGEVNYNAFKTDAARGFKATAQGAGLNDREIAGLMNIMGDDPRFVKMFNHIGKNFREDVLISGAVPSVPEDNWDNIFDRMFNPKGV